MTAVIKPPLWGMKRQWVKCKECGNVAYYDYIPYSLGNPIMTLPCGCWSPDRFDKRVTYLSAEAAATYFANKDAKRKAKKRKKKRCR